ncbi:MAG: TfoX/Sxy family protein [Alphaproteobacteria bacterium]
MAVSKEFLDYVAEQLEPFGRFAIRRMFSGAGLFRDGLMFALAIDDVLYLKADDANRGDFERAGTGPYTYQRAGRERSLGYYEVPVDVLEDSGALALWARNAHGAALRAARSPGARSLKRPSRGRPTRRR